MESTWFVFVFINIVIVFGIFAFIIWWGNQRIAKETGRKPLYKAISSGRIGLWSYKGPLVQMRMYEDFLVIGYTKHIVLLYDEIDAIVPGGKFFRRGITIKHHRSDLPQRIQLFNVSLEKVVTVFEQYSLR